MVDASWVVWKINHLVVGRVRRNKDAAFCRFSGEQSKWTILTSASLILTAKIVSSQFTTFIPPTQKKSSLTFPSVPLSSCFSSIQLIPSFTFLSSPFVTAFPDFRVYNFPGALLPTGQRHRPTKPPLHHQKAFFHRSVLTWNPLSLFCRGCEAHAASVPWKSAKSCVCVRLWTEHTCWLEYIIDLEAGGALCAPE